MEMLRHKVTPSAILIVLLTTAGSAWPQAVATKRDVTVTKEVGGSIQTQLSSAVIVNAESSVMREWLAMHDSGLPVDLVGTPGVSTVYVPDRLRGEYQYRAKPTVVAKEPLSAFEIRFLVFDVWGQHVKTLVADEIADMDAGVTKALSNEWTLLSENECSRHYASIAFISRVRTKDGRVLEADFAPIVREAQKFSKKFTTADLEPKTVTK
jgi:hypothetical protein